MNIINVKVFNLNMQVFNKTVDRIDFTTDNKHLTILPKYVDTVITFRRGFLSVVDKKTNYKTIINMESGVLVKTGRDIKISSLKAIINNNILDQENNNRNEKFFVDNSDIGSNLEEFFSNIKDMYFKQNV